MTTPTGRAALAAIAVLALAAVGGCGERSSDDAGAPSIESAPASASADGPTAKPSPAPTPTSEAEVAPIDATGPLVFPVTDPSTWPPGLLATVSPGGREASLALWGARAECAPFSLMLDYDAGLLSPEEYTAYAFYAMAPSLPSFGADPTGIELPERYVLCDEESLEVLGFAAAVFLEDIDPEFRDQLWLAIKGETYTDATGP